MTADAKREHFRRIVGGTPILICLPGARDAFVVVNETANVDIYLGYSGSISTLGMTLPGEQLFEDDYSQDEWWAYAPTSSGTLSGYIAR